jgi:hypothetical protein
MILPCELSFAQINFVQIDYIFWPGGRGAQVATTRPAVSQIGVFWARNYSTKGVLSFFLTGVFLRVTYWGKPSLYGG